MVIYLFILVLIKKHDKAPIVLTPKSRKSIHLPGEKCCNNSSTPPYAEHTSHILNTLVFLKEVRAKQDSAQ